MRKRKAALGPEGDHRRTMGVSQLFSFKEG